MKKAIKIISLTLALVIALFAFASCGSSSEGGEETEKAADEVKGTEGTWGNITLLVPEGMVMTGGNLINEDDPDTVNLKKSDDEMTYIIVRIFDEESAKSSIDMTREINDNCEDLTFEGAGTTWSGVQYDSFGYDIFVVYGELGEKGVMITSCGFKSDSDIIKAVVDSIKLA